MPAAVADIHPSGDAAASSVAPRASSVEPLPISAKKRVRTARRAAEKAATASQQLPDVSTPTETVDISEPIAADQTEEEYNSQLQQAVVESIRMQGRSTSLYEPYRPNNHGVASSSSGSQAPHAKQTIPVGAPPQRPPLLPPQPKTSTPSKRQHSQTPTADQPKRQTARPAIAKPEDRPKSGTCVAKANMDTYDEQMAPPTDSPRADLLATPSDWLAPYDPTPPWRGCGSVGVQETLDAVRQNASLVQWGGEVADDVIARVVEHQQPQSDQSSPRSRHGSIQIQLPNMPEQLTDASQAPLPSTSASPASSPRVSLKPAPPVDTYNATCCRTTALALRTTRC